MTTLKEIRERLIDELQIGFYGTADSITTTGVSWALRFHNTNWGGNQFKNWWGQRPGLIGTDAVKPMTTLSGSVLSHGSTVYADVGALKYFSLTRPEWHPTLYVLPLINRGLERAWQWWREPLTLVPDGSMEAATTAQWTGVTATLVKTSNSWSGARCLSVSNSAAGGYAESSVFPVAPERSFRFTAKAYAAAGSVPRLQVVNSNTGLVLATVTATSLVGSWQDLQVDGTFPGGCYGAKVRLVGVGAADYCAWDSVQGYWNLITRFELPEWVTAWRAEDGTEALRFYKVRNRLGTDGTWDSSAYDLMLLDPRDYQIIHQPSASTPLIVEFSRNVMIDGFPIMLEARRPFSDFGLLAADADITACPLRLAVAAAKVTAAMERRDLNDRLVFWQHDFDREQKRVSSLLQVPALDQPAGMAFQVWTP